ncbi:MAG: proton-conducting transporter membrane subunit, partial [Dehalococcoidia bacterium]
AVLFLVPALSLAGIPPLSGFFAKLALLQAGLRQQQYLIVAVSILVSLLTLFSMTKIWTEAFWKPAPDESAVVPRQGLLGLFAPVAALAALTVIIGLAAGPLFDLSLRAAEQLMDRRAYTEAVLGVGP